MTIRNLVQGLLFTAVVFGFRPAKADQVAVLFGLTQPILFNGYNVEINYLTDKFVLEYSHGWELKLDKVGRTSQEEGQNLKLKLPYTTGGGVGYRFTQSFHAAIEYKVHRFDVSGPNVADFSYTTQTLGVGIYYRWLPFGDNGFTVMPALRYWPTIATTLSGDKKDLGGGQVHEAHGFDLAPNIKIGYTF